MKRLLRGHAPSGPALWLVVGRSLGFVATFIVPIVLVRHFDQQDSNWKIKPELRQTITFRALNLLEDFAVLGQFDVVLCRNVLIYFDQPTKTRILAAIARRIVPDGVLLLGGAESVFGLSDAFAGIAGLKGVYGHADRIKPAPVVRPSLQLPAAS